MPKPVFILSFLLSLVSCTPVVDPATTGVEILAGTSSNFAFVNGAFSFSDDDRYLFGSNYDPTIHPVIEGEGIRHAYFYDLMELRKVPITMSEDVENHIRLYGVLEEAGCWQGQAVYVTTFTPRAIMANVAEPVPVWQVVDQIPCQRDERDRLPAMETLTPDDGSLVILDRDSDRELARHEPQALGGTAVIIDDLQMDDSARYLAYRVTRPRGSFSGNTQAFVIDLQAPEPTPQLLASPVTDLAFAGDHLYAQLSLMNSDDRRWFIGRWSLVDLNQVMD